MTEPWTLEVNSLLSELGSDPKKGLTSEEAARRLEKYGPNQLQLKKRTPPWVLFFRQFKSPMVYLLFFAAGIALFLGEHIDAIAILGVVILNSLIGFFQEYRAGVSIEALTKLSSPEARVIRDGKVVQIKAQEVVPGDVLVLEAGDYVVSDARLLEVNQLSSNEAVLTGESLPVEKMTSAVEADASLGDRINMVFSSTAIARGSGKAIVTATGSRSEIGKVTDLIKTAEQEETPLQQRLGKIGHKLLMLVGIVSVILIGVGFLQQRDWSEMIMSALSLAVAVIPEGLPAVVSIALVLGIRRMSKKRALVRKMDAVETLGATDIICTDKTGTLTTGKMLVRESFVPKEENRADHLRVLGLCNNASLESGGIGDTTEIALLRFALEEDSSLQTNSQDQKLAEWSFDSERKRMSVAVENQGSTEFLVKGAPENILNLCDASSEEREAIEAAVQSLSEKGMRVLATARRNAESSEVKNLSIEEVERNLQFLGLVGLADPPREESREAIGKCQRAGIKIVMITGDHPVTATAIARELGLGHGSLKTMIGKEIELLDPDQLRETVEDVSVYARVSPEHKLKIVRALQQNGHVVAMTGDGVNDAPALKQASIGVSMGKGGTEVARQASAMVLTDDNFATIVDAVEEGRAVHGNIKRTLQYLLSTNLALLCFILFSVFFAWPVPLVPVQLLWINLVTDGLPSLALAAEKVPAGFLEKSERPSANTFMDRRFYQELLVVAAIITIMGLIIYAYAQEHYPLAVARNFAFSFIVYSILFRSFSCRSETLTFLEMKINWFLIGTVSVPLIFQLVLQYVEPLASFFHVAPIELKQSLILILLSLIPVTAVEGFKVLKRRRVNKRRYE